MFIPDLFAHRTQGDSRRMDSLKEYIRSFCQTFGDDQADDQASDQELGENNS